MDFQIGDIINRTFGAISRNFITFFLLSTVLVGVPVFVMGLAEFGFASQDGAGIFIIYTISLLVNFLATYLLQGALIHGAISDFNGVRASFGDCLSTGLKHLLPVVAIGLMSTVGVMFGMVLLIVPGIILAIMWMFAIPVRVVEGAGVFDSFGRSRALSKDNRWRIFGLFLIYFVITATIGMVVALPLGIYAAMSGAGEASIGMASSMVFLIVNVLVTILSSMVGAAGVSALYYEIRKSKEGIGPEELAKVFD